MIRGNCNVSTVRTSRDVVQNITSNSVSDHRCNTKFHRAALKQTAVRVEPGKNFPVCTR